MSETNPPDRCVVLDIDGALVDSVHLHVLAWQRAFAETGLTVPSHRIHGAIGMGGDRLVIHAAGEAAEDAVGDRVRGRHRELFLDHLHDVRPTAGSEALLDGLRSRGVQLLVASSADREMTRALLGRLDLPGSAEAGSWLDEAVTGDQTDDSKPDPESLERVLGRTSARPLFMLGDAPWDALAAREAGVDCWGVLTGGFAETSLRAAGAAKVFEDPQALADRLDDELAGT